MSGADLSSPEKSPPTAGCRVNLAEKIWRIPAKITVALIEIIYQRGVGRLLPKVCIYEPSCSNYMIAAINAYGFWGGIARGVWRILRCHPFAKGGYDPVEKPRAPQNSSK